MNQGVTLKQIVLTALTILVVILVGTSLLSSFNKPQITSRLQLYQTDLLLRATTLFPNNSAVTSGSGTLQNAVLGDAPFETALTQYQSVRDDAQNTLDEFQTQLAQAVDQDAGLQASSDPDSVTARPSTDPGNALVSQQRLVAQQTQLLAQLDLRQGILYAHQGNIDQAQTLWQSAKATVPESVAFTTTVNVLAGLWNQPPRLLPDAEQVLQQELEGWFRYRGLRQLYDLQQRPDALVELQTNEQAIAQRTLTKLAIVNILPVFGCLLGIGLIVFLIVQRFMQGQSSLLASPGGSLAWPTPWTGEIIWQVLIAFFLAQFLVSLVLQLLGLQFTSFGTRARAVYTLTYYLTMSGIGLLAIYLSIKSHLPLPKDWFRISIKGRWFWWGLGGYFVALPFMILVALLNQQIWQGQGGSNPLLQVVLEEGDPVALSIFFFTAAVAAPIFEEILFRGFLLSSLTSRMPIVWAIALSSLIFATAHLSLSEVLPLAVLGAMLGFVYVRSRNLLAPMLLHSLWNSVTMLSLFILGSGMD